MATRDLNFNIFANDRASAAFARIAGAAEALAGTIVRLDRMRARPRVDLDTRGLEAKLAQAEARLEELNRKRVNPKIDADIAAAQAKMVQIAKELQALNRRRTDPKIDLDIEAARTRIVFLQELIEKLGKKRSTPRIDMDIAAAEASIARLTRSIEELNRRRSDPQLTVDIAAAEAKLVQLRSLIEDLNRQKSSPRVDADIAAAEAKIVAIKAQLAGIRDKTVRVDVDGARTLGILGRIGAAFGETVRSALFLRNAIRTIGAPTALITSLPALASLGGTLVAATKAANLLPGAFAFAGAAVSTLAFAFSGLTDAIGPRDTGTQIKKANLAMSRLGENAKAVAKQVIAFKDEWNGLKKAIQETAFANIAGRFKELGETYIPMLKNGFKGLAAEFNGMAIDLFAFFRRAETINDTNMLFSMFKQTLVAFRPAVTNIAYAFKDLAIVGSSFLPGLAEGFSNMTERFSNFIAKARSDGSLRLWTAQGIIAIRELGSLIGAIAGTFNGIFTAANQAGASFVQTWTIAFQNLENWTKSNTGKAGLIAFFQSIREAVVALSPAVKSLLDGMANGFMNLRPAITPIGAAISSIAAAVGPALAMIAKLFTAVVVPIANAAGFLANAFSGVIPAVLTLAVAFKALGLAGGMLAGLGARVVALSTGVGMAALAMHASGAASQRMADGTSKVGNALTRVGNSLPLIGVAFIALSLVFDKFGSDFNGAADKVIKGSQTMGQAIEEEAAKIRSRIITWDSAAAAEEALARATTETTRRFEERVAAMSPLEALQARVTRAEGDYADAVKRSGPSSAEAAFAAAGLKTARDNLTIATEREAIATESATDALVRNAQEVQASASADAGLERARLNLEQQQIRTTDALKKNSSASLEGRTATRDLTDATLRAAEAAGVKAEADAKARGETDAAAQGARAYELELIRLAGQATGPTRQAFLGMIANLETTKNGSNDAALKVAGLTKEVKAVPPGQSTAFSQPGMDDAIRKLGELNGRIMALKDRTLLFKAIGEWQVANPQLFAQLATGGIVPGYSPGVDDTVVSGPGGRPVALSGGEAVMRPEWTRAMGAEYVHAANMAARTGGVGGVREFAARTAPRGSALEGFKGDGSAFAAGGVVSRNVSVGGGFRDLNPTVEQWYEAVQRKIAATFAAQVKKAMASGGNGLAWARTQVGKPYIWGGVGPAGYDCSGFMSAIVNVMRGRNPHSRVGATGNFPWAGFRPGIGPGLSIGSFRGNPGHMAGTIGGTNVESSGGVGVRVGGGARGAGDGMFNTRAHLPFDDGGRAGGRGWMYKNTLQPERVLSPVQTEAFERLVSWLTTTRGNSSGGDGAAAVQMAIQNGIRLAVSEARQVVINYTAAALSNNGVSSNAANELRNLAQMGDLMPESFTINGVNLNNFANVIQDAKGFGMSPGVKDLDIELAGRHGALASNRVRYEAGVLTLPMWIKGVVPGTGLPPVGSTDIDQFYKNVDSLYRLLSSRVLTVVHTRPDGVSRQATGHLVATLDLSREVSSPLWGQFTAQIKIPGSFWQDTATVSNTASLTTGSTLSLTNFTPSTAPMTDLTITLGPGNNPQVTQASTGVFVAYDGVISAGRQLVIDTSTWTLDDGAGTAWSPDYSLLRHGGDSYLFSITPNYDGTATNVTLVHTTGGSMSLTVAGYCKYLTA